MCFNLSCLVWWPLATDGCWKHMKGDSGGWGTECLSCLNLILKSCVRLEDGTILNCETNTIRKLVAFIWILLLTLLYKNCVYVCVCARAKAGRLWFSRSELEFKTKSYCEKTYENRASTCIYKIMNAGLSEENVIFLK